MLLLLRVDANVDYVTELLPALLVFSLGLSMTVAPLTATVLADADEHNAGLASGINNAIARVAGLFGVAALGAVVAAQFNAQFTDRLSDRPLSPAGQATAVAARERTLGRVAADSLPPAEARRLDRAAEAASVSAFHTGVGIAAALVALGGVLGLVGIAQPASRGLLRGLPGAASSPARPSTRRGRAMPSRPNGTPTERAPGANRRLACG